MDGIKEKHSIKIEEIVSNVKIFGLEDSIKAAKYPMSVNIDTLNDEMTNGIHKLGMAPRGSGHDNFLKGIIVQFDLTFSNKVWPEAERYHWLDFVSSQSTMHRIARFDLDNAYIDYVDQRIIDIMKEKVSLYNALLEHKPEGKDEAYEEAVKEAYLNILYNNPAGFKLTARMTTNYQQLKTIYGQRKTHKLPEWRVFCKWLETLPYSEFITLDFGDDNE